MCVFLCVVHFQSSLLSLIFRFLDLNPLELLSPMEYVVLNPWENLIQHKGFLIDLVYVPVHDFVNFILR